MIIKELIQTIEQNVPLCLQESYDNSGLIVGDASSEIKGVLLCVDITEVVVAEAIEKGCNLVISHHPVIFHPLKKLKGDNQIERTVIMAIKNDIALYGSHTPLDQVPEGLSHRLADSLGIKNRVLLSSSNPYDAACGFGIVGELDNATTLADFLALMKNTLSLKAIRYAGEPRSAIKRIALCTGSGSSLIEAAKSKGADLYISADFKYNDFLDASKEIIIADIGHFESEYCAIDVLYDIITKKNITFALHKSEKGENPINYFV